MNHCKKAVFFLIMVLTFSSCVIVYPRSYTNYHNYQYHRLHKAIRHHHYAPRNKYYH